MKQNSAAEKPPLRHRRVGFDFDNVPRYWNEGDPFMTRLMDALSVTFPGGERFFIETVRAFENAVTDEKLREEMQLFMRQEGQHGAAHNQYNRLLSKQGIDVAAIVQEHQADQDEARRSMSPTMQLALTAASEHLTALLAEGLLNGSRLLGKQADPEMRALYLWHSVEEAEHKAVAFDVYERFAGGDYRSRALALLLVTLYMHVKTASAMRHMFAVDGLRDTRRVFAQGLWRLYGPRGLLTRLLPSYFAWFSPTFHPWQRGIPECAASWIRTYETTEDAHVSALQIS
jgi:predicted metal-dependent hydrolase